MLYDLNYLRKYPQLPKKIYLREVVFPGTSKVVSREPGNSFPGKSPGVLFGFYLPISDFLPLSFKRFLINHYQSRPSEASEALVAQNG